METKNRLQPLARTIAGEKDLRGSLPAEIEMYRRGEVLCPVCEEEGRIVLSREGPMFDHPSRHQAEDQTRRLGKKLLKSHLQELFPDSRIELDAELPGGFLDLVLVRPTGTKLGLRFQSEDLREFEVSDWSVDMKAIRAALFWLLDARHLPQKAIDKSGEVKVNIGRNETELLLQKKSLIYFSPEEKMLYWAALQRDDLEKIFQTKIPPGESSVLIRRYHLSQLRIREGEWWVDKSFD